MSQLKVNTIRHTGASSDAITLANDGTATARITNNLSNRQINMNGAMRVSQRGTSFSFAHDGTTSGYTIDRFKYTMTSCDSYDCTVTQDSSGPDGFSKSLKVTTGTAESAIAAGEYSYIDTRLEGWDVQHLNYGDADAKATLVSFWVKSSVTGTFGFSIYRGESTDRIINVPYTISSANTWEKKTLAINGDTAQAVGDVSTEKLRLMWTLWAGTGMTSAGASNTWTNYSGDATKFQAGHVTNTLATTAGATFYLTGVQFEVDNGSGVATDFEHRRYIDEFNRCQRYYFVACKGDNVPFCAGESHNGSQFVGFIKYPTEMRATPTLKHNDGTSYYQCYGNSTSDNCDSVGTSRNCPTGFVVALSGNLSLTQGTGTYARTANASALIAFDAEL